jgi:hypothetical protein
LPDLREERIVSLVIPLIIWLARKAIRVIRPGAGASLVGEPLLLLIVYTGCWVWLALALQRVYGSRRAGG